VTTVSGKWEVKAWEVTPKPISFYIIMLMMNIEKKVWVERNNHTVPMVCFGTSLDHLVLSPFRAHEIGSLLIKAASDALMTKEDLNDES
jgi:hypothetical protein